MNHDIAFRLFLVVMAFSWSSAAILSLGSAISFAFCLEVAHLIATKMSSTLIPDIKVQSLFATSALVFVSTFFCYGVLYAFGIAS